MKQGFQDPVINQTRYNALYRKSSSVFKIPQQPQVNSTLKQDRLSTEHLDLNPEVCLEKPVPQPPVLMEDASVVKSEVTDVSRRVDTERSQSADTRQGWAEGGGEGPRGSETPNSNTRISRSKSCSNIHSVGVPKLHTESHVQSKGKPQPLSDSNTSSVYKQPHSAEGHQTNSGNQQMTGNLHKTSSGKQQMVGDLNKTSSVKQQVVGDLNKTSSVKQQVVGNTHMTSEKKNSQDKCVVKSASLQDTKENKSGCESPG